jgi:hypothetical protein
VKHLADVLDDELSFSQGLFREQPVAFLPGSFNIQLGVFLRLELLVLTRAPARAKVRVALHQPVFGKEKRQSFGPCV